MTIYFLSPAPPEVAGGVQKIYRFVEILHRANVEVAVVHPRSARVPSWVGQPDVPVRSTSKLSLSGSDLLVVPEKYVWRLDEQRLTAPRVILNQGAYVTFAEASLPPPSKSPYMRDEVLAVVTVSEDSERYLRYAFGSLQVYRIRLGIDSDLYRPLAKRRALAFMPRRGAAVAKQVLGILAARGSLYGWDIDLLDRMSRSDVASRLGEAMIFLSFAEAEGFGLPALEAMACGCFVVGFSGRGGSEYFKREHSVEILDGDIVEFARQVEAALANPDECAKRGKLASAFVRNMYPLWQEESDVLAAFGRLDPPRSRGATEVLDMSIFSSPGRLRRGAWRLRHLLD